jgi:hypothetical protein
MSRPHGREEPNRGYARRDDDRDRERDRDDRSRGPEVSNINPHSPHLCFVNTPSTHLYVVAVI